MKHVRTEVLRAGMVVATDVISPSNQLVFPKGTVLTERQIGRLEAYEVYDIRIEDPVDYEVEEIPEDEVDLSGAQAGIDGAVMGTEADSLLNALTGMNLPEDKPEVVVKEFEEPSHFEKLKASREFQAFKESFTENVDGPNPTTAWKLSVYLRAGSPPPSPSMMAVPTSDSFRPLPQAMTSTS